MNKNWILSLSAVWLYGPIYDLYEMKNSNRVVLSSKIEFDKLKKHISNEQLSTFLRIICDVQSESIHPDKVLSFIHGSSICKKITKDRQKLHLMNNDQKMSYLNSFSSSKKLHKDNYYSTYLNSIIEYDSCFPKASLAAADIANGVMFLRILISNASAYEEISETYLNQLGERASKLYDNYESFATDAAIGNTLIHNYLCTIESSHNKQYNRNLSRALFGLYGDLIWNPN